MTLRAAYPALIALAFAGGAVVALAQDKAGEAPKVVAVQEESSTPKTTGTANYKIEAKTMQKGLYARKNCKPEFKDSAFNDCYCKSDVSYPMITSSTYDSSAKQLTQLIVNKALNIQCLGDKQEKKDKTEEEQGQERNFSYEVMLQSPKILSLRLDSYSYDGGAHGMPGVEAVTTNLATNKVYALRDVIGQNEQAANKAIYDALMNKPEGEVFKEELKAQPRTFIKDGECKGCIFYLTPKGLTIMFQAYEVAPYSSGNVDVTLPNSIIADKDILNELESKN